MDEKLEIPAVIMDTADRRTIDVAVEGDQGGKRYQIGFDESKTFLVLEYRDKQMVIDAGDLLAAGSAVIDAEIKKSEAGGHADSTGNA